MGAEVLGWAGRQKVGDVAAKLVLMALADSCNDKTGECYPRRSTIMEYAECGEDHVKRKLRKLEKDGWIKRTPRYDQNGRQTSSSYTIIFERGVSFEEWRKQRREARGDRNPPTPAQGGAESPPVGGPGAPVEGGLGAPPRTFNNERKKDAQGSEGTPAAPLCPSRPPAHTVTPDGAPVPATADKRREIGAQMNALVAQMRMNQKQTPGRVMNSRAHSNR
jgi:hypothetical protein